MVSCDEMQGYLFSSPRPITNYFNSFPASVGTTGAA